MFQLSHMFQYSIFMCKISSFIFKIVKSVFICPLLTSKFATNLNQPNSLLKFETSISAIFYCAAIWLSISSTKESYWNLVFQWIIFFFEIYELNHRNSSVLFLFSSLFDIVLHSTTKSIYAELRINLELPEINYLSAINNSLTTILVFTIHFINIIGLFSTVHSLIHVFTLQTFQLIKSMLKVWKD